VSDIPQTRTAKVSTFFGDGEQAFRLAHGELVELDEKLEVGPHVLFEHLTLGTWRVGQVREVLRVGLIGGGMKPDRAAAMVRRYVEEVPDWVKNAAIARLVVGAAIYGVEVEKLGKSSGEGPDPSPSPTAESASETSTESEPPSA
jgi:hypothetical protein